MKLRGKLLAVPLATALVVLGVGALHASIQQAGARLEREAWAQDASVCRTVGQLQSQLKGVEAAMYRTLALLSSLDDAQIKSFMSSAQKELDDAGRTVGELAGSERADAELRKRFEALGPLLTTYRKQIAKAVEMSGVDAAMGAAAMKAAEGSFKQIAQAMADALAKLEAASQQRQAAIERQSTLRGALFGALALLASALSLAAGWWMQRRLVADLQRAVGVATEVAAGRLTAQADNARRDEIGDLMRALDRMVQGLRESLRTVQTASASIGNASQEIAAGNGDLSQRTEQTASNLQQSASSIEQLTGAVRQSADSASQASQLATSAAEVARRGGQVVAQVVSTMNEINTSSRKIGDIIGTIDGIAFQTNILALNAAVEAARAGEQGRGFAVVAGEVRSLAQRSAEAAREIKSLIGASVERVEAGSRLVQDAGGTMKEIVTGVQRVSDIIAEISTAAGEQSSGIGQVNASVAQLDQMTQQNAALVEQSAAAAESLNQQARRLAEVVGRFVLGDGDTAARAAGTAPR